MVSSVNIKKSDILESFPLSRQAARRRGRSTPSPRESGAMAWLEHRLMRTLAKGLKRSVSNSLIERPWRLALSSLRSSQGFLKAQIPEPSACNAGSRRAFFGRKSR
jgi:hypothetical protein